MTSDQLSPEQRRRVGRHKSLVDRLARRMLHRLPRMSEDELRSVGYEALVHCGLRYDPAQGIPFAGFCYYRVRGAMIDAARRAMPELRRRSRAMRTLEATQALLERAHDREPVEGADPRTLRERVETAAEIIAQATTAVVLARVGSPDPEAVADGTATPDEALDFARLRDHVRRLIDEYDEDERAIISGLYYEGLSMTELGTRLGRDKSTVSRRHATLLRRLSRALQPGGSEG
ncbi:MAG: sigma-70 family RNA polymerase sigma factor [Myxococcales bacterium]|nr:sigma-70 family RNA polymerase sigma factor [Myxococcales bacterium]